jgi:hypothetical protein
LRHISILVFGLIGMGPMNSIVFIAALSGAVVRVMREKGLAVRLCAAFLIATTALHLLGAATYVMGDKYAGVSPIYFEWFIWPLVFVLATWLAAWLGKALLSRIPGVREALIQ